MNEAARWRVVDDGFVAKERYVDPGFGDAELSRLWARVWQVAGRVEQLPDAGSHLVYEIGDESVLVVRGDDGRVRAFHNACLHRGTRLAAQAGQFEDGRIRCRYHAWEYEFDGALRAVPDRDDFDLPDDLCLAAVRCECWGGFVFVNLDHNAEPLAEFLAPLCELLGPYRVDEMRLRAVLSTELPANWKTAVDAFNESYHVQGTHPQILRWTDDVAIEYESFGRHGRFGRLPGARRALVPSPRLELEPEEYDEGEILAGLVEGLGGAFLAEEKELVATVRALGLEQGELLAEYQRRRRDLLASRGLDVSELSDEQMTSAEDFYCFPNMVGPVYPGSAILFRARPVGRDPNRCIHDTWVLEWRGPDEPARMPRTRAVADWTTHDWGEITNQDYANMSEVQLGMRTSGFNGLRLNPRQEALVLAMHREIDAYLFD